MSRPDLPPPAPGATVTALVPAVSLRVDAEPLLRLQTTQGPQATRDLVSRTCEELDHRLGQVSAHYRDSALAALAAEARGIAAAAMPVGLTELARAAAHVSACCSRNDPAALAATVARLVRLGDRALGLIGNLRMPRT